MRHGILSTLSRVLFALLLLLAVQACKHPLAIRGEGDIVDSGSAYGCTLEQFRSGHTSCTDNDVQGDYFVNYQAVPRPGWQFEKWEGSCGHLTLAPDCRFDVPGVWVAYWDSDIGVPIPTLTAVFVQNADGPTAAFTATADFSSVPLTVTSDASSSSDPDSDIVAYDWDFGDGNQGEGMVVSHQYAAAGTYSQTLTVTDGNGNTSSVADRVYAAVGEDPLLGQQWHLNNTGQSGNDGTGVVGEDLNVFPVWAGCGVLDSCRGEGVTVAVVDDGLDITHEDLAANVVPGGSFNYLADNGDPSPTVTRDRHGTAVAGIIGAVGFNDVGVVGVAPRTGLVGYNLLAVGTATAEQEATAMANGQEDISNNSWGPEDGLGTYWDAPQVWIDAILFGLTQGRGGLGKIYLWAAGNGFPADYSGTDAYASYPGVIAVGALDDKGKSVSYSEAGANVLISAPAGEYCDTHTITTTDVTGTFGYNPPDLAGDPPDDVYPDESNQNYTRCMNGTSAATPMVSGVVALMLQANGNLGWRDVRAILATTARKTDPENFDWFDNGAGLHFNHFYGFGAVDAAAAVAAARSWRNFGELKTTTHPLTVERAIPDDDETGLVAEVMVTGGVDYIEFVSLQISSDHAARGELEVLLTHVETAAESAMVLHLDFDNPPRDTTPGLDFTFRSVKHLGEPADGTWRVTVRDQWPQNTGTWNSLELTISGH